MKILFGLLEQFGAFLEWIFTGRKKKLSDHYSSENEKENFFVGLTTFLVLWVITIIIYRLVT